MKGRNYAKRILGVIGVAGLIVVGGMVLYTRWGMTTKSDYYGEYVEAGKEYMSQGMYVEAEAEFKKAESIAPDSNVQTAIAECRLAMEDYGTFMSLADQIQSSYGMNEKLYRDMAFYYSEVGDEKSSICTLMEGVSAYPDSEELRRAYDKVKGSFTQSGYSAEDVAGSISGYYIDKNEKGWCVLSPGMNRIGDNNFNKIMDVSDDECVAETFPETEIIISVKSGKTIEYYDGNGYKRKSPEGGYNYVAAPRCGYILVNKKSKWGFIDLSFAEQGDWYDDATSFSGGMAAVKKNGKWAFIDTEFNPITEYAYGDVAVDDCHRCSVSGTAFAKKDGKYVIVTANGELPAGNEYDMAKPFAENGGYAACLRDGCWFLVDDQGRETEAPDCEDLSSSENGIAQFCKDKKWGYMGVNDGEYVAPQYDMAMAVNIRGYAAVELENEWSYIHFTRFDENDDIF